MPNNNSIISTIHTACKNCVFADYKDNTQVNCFLGMIDKYKNKNIEVLEAYDEEKEFYIVNNKKCFGYKEPKYFISRQLDDKPMEDKINYIKQKMVINYVAVINLTNFSLQNLDHILSVLSVANVLPKKIVLVRYVNQGENYSYENIKNILDQHKTINWTIKTVLDPEDSYQTILHNIVNTSKKNNFILSIDKDFTNLLNIVNKAQTSVYEDFSFFNYITSSTKGCILFNGAVYRMNIFYGIDILSLDENPNNIIV